MEFLPGVRQAVRLLNRARYFVVVVSSWKSKQVFHLQRLSISDKTSICNRQAAPRSSEMIAGLAVLLDCFFVHLHALARLPGMAGCVFREG
jgi:hypothetical protein